MELLGCMEVSDLLDAASRLGLHVAYHAEKLKIYVFNYEGLEVFYHNLIGTPVFCTEGFSA